jgi:hypothetical protein
LSRSAVLRDTKLLGDRGYVSWEFFAGLYKCGIRLNPVEEDLPNGTLPVPVVKFLVNLPEAGAYSFCPI